MLSVALFLRVNFSILLVCNILCSNVAVFLLLTLDAKQGERFSVHYSSVIKGKKRTGNPKLAAIAVLWTEK